MPTLLGLCFNTLEHVVAELVQQEAIGELIMGHVVIILLLNTYVCAIKKYFRTWCTKAYQRVGKLLHT